jgi:hypothetical protein
MYGRWGKEGGRELDELIASPFQHWGGISLYLYWGGPGAHACPGRARMRDGGRDMYRRWGREGERQSNGQAARPWRVQATPDVFFFGPWSFLKRAGLLLF